MPAPTSARKSRDLDDLSVAFVATLTSRMAAALRAAGVQASPAQLAAALHDAVQPHTAEIPTDPEVDYVRWLSYPDRDPSRAAQLTGRFVKTRAAFAADVAKMPDAYQSGPTAQSIMGRYRDAQEAQRTLGSPAYPAERPEVTGIDPAAAVAVTDRFEVGILAALAETGARAHPYAIVRGLHNTVAAELVSTADDPETDHARRVFADDPERGVALIRALTDMRVTLYREAERDRAAHMLILTQALGVKVADVVRMLPGLTRQQYERAKKRAGADAILGNMDGVYASPVAAHDVEWWSASTKDIHRVFVGMNRGQERARLLRRQAIWDLVNNKPLGQLPYSEIARMIGGSDGLAERTGKLATRPADDDTTDD